MTFTLGNCRIDNDVCLKHAYRISKDIKCPDFPGDLQQWKVEYQCNMQEKIRKEKTCLV